jgi:hypothetical protein
MDAAITNKNILAELDGATCDELKVFDGCSGDV